MSEIWGTVLDNGKTASTYAEELRGPDPTSPLHTYEQIADFLRERGVKRNIEEVRNHFRLRGFTAPYAGQSKPDSAYIKNAPTVHGPYTPVTANRSGVIFASHRDSEELSLTNLQGAIPADHPSSSIDPNYPHLASDLIPPFDDEDTTIPTVGEIVEREMGYLDSAYDPKNDAAYLRSALDDHREALEKKRQDRLLKDLVQRQSLTEMFVDGVRESVAPIEYPPFVAYPFGMRRHARRRAAVQHISDIHIGKLAPGFNIEVIKDRLDQVITTLHEQVERERLVAEVDELHILFGGDLCDGANIFPTQHAHSEQNIRNQIWRYGHPYLADFIRTAASGFRDVYIDTVPGNHGRLSKFHDEQDNCDVYLYETLSIATKHINNVHFNVNANWYCVHEVLGTKILMVHGQQHVSNYGLPFYSVSRRALAWQQSIPESWDLEILGHFHCANDLDISGIRVILNGSFVSADEYALEKMGAQSDPSQTLLIIDEEAGLVQRTLCHLR